MHRHFDFLAGDSQMARLIRELDWSATPLGEPGQWPAGLRTSVRLMLTTGHPVFIFWGDELTCLYNDAFARSIGPEKHPSTLGAPGRVVWDEIWDIIGPQIDLVMSRGGATWHENQLVPITRHGRRENVYWTYSQSPIDDQTAPSGIGGILVLCTETTQAVEAHQQAKTAAEEAASHLQETLHRVKNNISAIIAMVNIETRKTDDPNLHKPLHRISARLRTFSTLYELMLTSRTNETIEVGSYLKSLCAATSDLFSHGNAAAIDLTVKADDYEMMSEDAFHLGAIVVELLSNAYAHAFFERREGRIDVAFTHDGDNLILTLADDGIGVEATSQPESGSTGIGTLLVNNYVETLHGSLEQLSGADGTRYRIVVPIK